MLFRSYVYDDDAQVKIKKEDNKDWHEEPPKNGEPYTILESDSPLYEYKEITNPADGEPVQQTLDVPLLEIPAAELPVAKKRKQTAKKRSRNQVEKKMKKKKEEAAQDVVVNQSEVVVQQQLPVEQVTLAPVTSATDQTNESPPF